MSHIGTPQWKGASTLRWPKPDSLALHPALVDLGPASRSIRQFGLEDQMPSRPGLPQVSGRLWIARTQEPSPPDARNTACQSLYFPRGIPPAPTPLRGKSGFVPAESTKVNLSVHQTTLRFGNVLEFKRRRRQRLAPSLASRAGSGAGAVSFQRKTPTS